MLVPGKKLSVEEPLQIRQRWAAQERLVRHHPQQWHPPVVLQPRAQVLPSLFDLVMLDLVDYNSGDADTVGLAHVIVQVQLVERAPQPPVCHKNHVRPHHRCDLSVIGVDAAPDSNVTGPFENLGLGVVGGVDGAELVVTGDLAVNIVAGVAGGDDYWGHVLVVEVVQFEVFADELEGGGRKGRSEGLSEAKSEKRRGSELDSWPRDGLGTNP